MIVRFRVCAVLFVIFLIHPLIRSSSHGDSSKCMTCKSPAPIDASCIKCYNYDVVSVTTIEVRQEEACVPTDYAEWIKACIAKFFPAAVDDPSIYGTVASYIEPLCGLRGQDCSVVDKVTVISEPKCEVEATAVYSACLESCPLMVTLPPPGTQGSVVCFGNFQSPFNVFPLQSDDLFAYPVMSSLQKTDDFCISYGPGIETNDIFTLKDKYFQVPFLDIAFLSPSVSEKAVQILMVQEGNITGVNSAKNMSIGNCTAANKPGGSSTISVPTACRCKRLPKPITALCSSESLLSNPVYQKYFTSPIPHGGSCGFDSLKGCLGADFFQCDGTFRSPTEEECRSFTLGMTPAEVARFLMYGASLWNEVLKCPQGTISDCTTNAMRKRIGAQTLLQLEGLLYQPTDCKYNTCCEHGKNQWLKTIACKGSETLEDLPSSAYVYPTPSPATAQPSPAYPTPSPTCKPIHPKFH